MNIPWRHELRIEGRLKREAETGGSEDLSRLHRGMRVDEALHFQAALLVTCAHWPAANHRLHLARQPLRGVKVTQIARMAKGQKDLVR